MLLSKLLGKFSRLAIPVFSSAVVLSCTSGLKPAAFRAPLRTGPHRTVVLFLVDGLAVKTLQAGLRKERIPNLRRFFLGNRTSFQIGQASFPTLTYPNISSILTSRPVGEQPVISNHVLAPNGKILNYEDAKFHPLLRSSIDSISQIAELNRQGRETASFSYVFGLNAYSKMRVGVREGLEYQKHDFRDLDDRLLGDLEEFLQSRAGPSEWPDFIYVHLVGVDGTSHRFGPDSVETREYLHWLDSRMSPTLAFLAAADKSKGANVVTILTADHGFVNTHHYAPLSKIVRKADLNTIILNEGRFLGLHQPPGRSARELLPVLRALREQPSVELSVFMDGSVLELARGRKTARFAIGPPVCEGEAVSLALLPERGNLLPASGFRCPSEFDDVHGEYPFLLAGISRYLNAPNHPDAIVVAKPDVSFAAGMRGSHGGPTAEESFVPVLLRNAALQGKNAVRTSELLKLLRD